MTCHDALALLEEYVDNETSADNESLIRKHLETCDECRLEFEEAILLKDALKQTKPADPGDQYWSETTNLILARTTESFADDQPTTSIIDIRSAERGAFMRALVSVAASLVILFSALLIGSGQQQKISRTAGEQPPVYVSAPLEQAVGSDNTIIVTQDEKDRLSRGMLLLGAPGTLGRFLSPLELAPTSN